MCSTCRKVPTSLLLEDPAWCHLIRCFIVDEAFYKDNWSTIPTQHVFRCCHQILRCMATLELRYMYLRYTANKLPVIRDEIPSVREKGYYSFRCSRICGDSNGVCSAQHFGQRFLARQMTTSPRDRAVGFDVTQQPAKTTIVDGAKWPCVLAYLVHLCYFLLLRWIDGLVDHYMKKFSRDAEVWGPAANSMGFSSGLGSEGGMMLWRSF